MRPDGLSTARGNNQGNYKSILSEINNMLDSN